MYFTQHYLDCLSQASYLIGDETTGQAVVVDPRRDIAEYLSDAADHGLRIIGVINTHFHADFLSGHLEMAQATGAWIGYGQGAHAEFQIRSLADGERITLGEVTLEIMHTPGHTPESISVLVYEHPDDDIAYGVLTGDALFIGDVGRPDLLASIGVTADELGHQLYDSIQRKLMGLPDAVRVFPAHGAGSACGKNLSTEKQSTIGEQRLFNYACQPMNEADFVALVTAGQPPAPDYFLYDAILNRKDRAAYDAGQPLAALGTAEMLIAISGGALVVDARDAQDFAAGHLTGALNVPADGRFAETAGMILQPADEVVVMAPDAGSRCPTGPDRLRPGHRLCARRRDHPRRPPGTHLPRQPPHPSPTRRGVHIPERPPGHRRPQRRGTRRRIHPGIPAHPAGPTAPTHPGDPRGPAGRDLLRRRLALERRRQHAAPPRQPRRLRPTRRLRRLDRNTPTRERLTTRKPAGRGGQSGPHR